jgi:ElaB/YqjD/DUF883 family membrane-anchored ribosome-binding protein
MHCHHGTPVVEHRTIYGPYIVGEHPCGFQDKRTHTEACLEEMSKAFNAEINKLKMEFMAAIKKTKKRMTNMLQTYITDMLRTYMGNMICKTDELMKHMDPKVTKNAEAMFEWVATLKTKTNADNKTPSPPRKQQRLQPDGTAMVDITHTLLQPLQLDPTAYPHMERQHVLAK